MQPRNSVDELSIDPDIITRHTTRCEALLEAASHLPAIADRRHLHRNGAGLVDLYDDHAGDALIDHLLDRAGAIGKYRGSQTIASIMTRPNSGSGEQIGNDHRAVASRRTYFSSSR